MPGVGLYKGSWVKGRSQDSSRYSTLASSSNSRAASKHAWPAVNTGHKLPLLVRARAGAEEREGGERGAQQRVPRGDHLRERRSCTAARPSTRSCATTWTGSAARPTGPSSARPRAWASSTAATCQPGALTRRSCSVDMFQRRTGTQAPPIRHPPLPSSGGGGHRARQCSDTLAGRR